VWEDGLDNYELEGSLASRRDVNGKCEASRQEGVVVPSAAITTDFAGHSEGNSRG
jgi:hypothetical protein